MEDVEEIINFDECPLEKIVVFINGYAEVQRRATVRLNITPSSQQSATTPQATPQLTHQPLPELKQLNTNKTSNKSTSTVSRTLTTPTPAKRTSSSRSESPHTRRVSTRRHTVAVRGLPGACLASESMRVELIDYKGTVPVSLDDVQLVHAQNRRKPPVGDGKLDQPVATPSATMLLEQQSIRDQLGHIRRRYESALSRKHRLLAQRTILDRVADSMTRGTSPLAGDLYGAASLYADPMSLLQSNAALGESYRPMSMPNVQEAQPLQQQQQQQQQQNVGTGAGSSQFMPTPHFVDALQGFLQLYDDRTHKVDDSLADTAVEIAHLEEQLNYLSGLCSEVEMRAPSPNIILLTLSHFVINNNAPDPAGDGQNLLFPQLHPSNSNQTAIATLSLSYTVYGAFWNPSYELRLRPDDSAVQLVYSVAITQSTGEDWIFQKNESGENVTAGTRLLVSTSLASTSPEAPTAPTADRIYMRGSSGGPCMRKINQLKAAVINAQRTSTGSYGNPAGTPAQQLRFSTPNLLAGESCGPDQQRPGQQFPGYVPSPAMRPYSTTSLSQLHGQRGPIFMHNETCAPDSLGYSPSQRAPIQNASSFATFLSPGQSMNNIVPNETTGDYDNDLCYATPGSDQAYDSGCTVPSGIIIEADILSACSATKPEDTNAKTVQFVLSSGATVQLPCQPKPEARSQDDRTVVVRVPTARQSALTPVKFVVGCHDLEVISLSYEATPRLSASAFATAHLRNTSPLPLLAGSVAVFHDRATGSALFAYRTQLPYVGVGEDFVVSLGPDPAVEIDYQAPQRRYLLNGMNPSKADSASPGLSRHESLGRSKSHDHQQYNSLQRKSKENAENKTAAISKWSYYRQLIGITNKHTRALIRIHLTEPLPKPADSHLRLVLEAPMLLEADKQIENGKRVRASRKTRFTSKGGDNEGFVARLNSSHQLEWDLTMRGGEMRYLEIRYRLEYKPGVVSSVGTTVPTTTVRMPIKPRESSIKLKKYKSNPFMFDSSPKPTPSNQRQQRQSVNHNSNTNSLPRPVSAQPPRPASPGLAAGQQPSQMATVAAATSSSFAVSMSTATNNRPVSPFQVQPMLTPQPQHRSGQLIPVAHDQQQTQRPGTIRYTAC